MADISNVEKLLPRATFINMLTRAWAYYRSRTPNVWPGKVWIYPGKQGDYVSQIRFLDMKWRYEAYEKLHGTGSTNNIWIKRPAVVPTPEPVVTDNCYSSTRWSIVLQHYAQQATCGPSSFVEAIAEFGVTDLTHEEAAVLMHTNVGTAPTDLIAGGVAALKKRGINVKTYTKNFSDVGWKGVGELIADPRRTFVLHHCYKCNPDWGHYVALMKVCLDTKLVTVAENLHGAYEVRPFSSLQCDMSCMKQPSLIIFEKI